MLGRYSVNSRKHRQHIVKKFVMLHPCKHFIFNHINKTDILIFRKSLIDHRINFFQTGKNLYDIVCLHSIHIFKHNGMSDFFRCLFQTVDEVHTILVKVVPGVCSFYCDFRFLSFQSQCFYIHFGQCLIGQISASNYRHTDHNEIKCCVNLCLIVNNYAGRR